MEAWTQFFVRAGIPQNVSQKYAKTFHTNRITKEMLPDLDKATLSELGVNAIGDQLCILRRIKAAKSAIEQAIESDDEPMQPKASHKPSKSRITAPEASSSNSGISTASESRRGKPPPDRNEIYHVKMPSGNTMRTQKIMRKAEEMRQQGLSVRGTTGVRQGGRSVSPIDKTSLAARMVRKQNGALEVSSSTDRGDRNHHGHHRHSQVQVTKIARISSSSIKKTVPTRPSLSSRLTGASKPSAVHNSSSRRISGGNGSNGIRIHVDEPKPKSRIAGRLQKAPIKSGNVVVEYEDYGEEAVMEEVAYDDDEELYEAIMEETDDVLTIPSPVHSRITYSSPSSAPRRGNAGTSSDSVFSRVSYRR